MTRPWLFPPAWLANGHTGSAGYRVDITCKGDPMAEVGDTVPVMIESSQ